MGFGSGPILNRVNPALLSFACLKKLPLMVFFPLTAFLLIVLFIFSPRAHYILQSLYYSV
jgi:hypothetical protein